MNRTNRALLSIGLIVLAIGVYAIDQHFASPASPSLLPPHFYLEQNTVTNKFRWCGDGVGMVRRGCSEFINKTKQDAVTDAWGTYNYLVSTTKGEWIRVEP